MRRHVAFVVGLVGASLVACSHDNIPNTDVEDTDENKEIVLFMEKYRNAVERRDVSALLAMTSRDYYDDNGTPTGDDDVDYQALVAGLDRVKEEISDTRYQIRYRSLTYSQNGHVLVDMLYTGWFKVATAEGPEWRRRLEPHRIVLAPKAGTFKIISGL